MVRRAIGAVGILALSISVGCGDSGSGGAPRGALCANNVDPIPAELSPGNDNKGPSKVALNGSGADLAAHAGVYTYEGAEIFYRNAKTGAQIHVSEVKSRKTGQWTSTVNCVSGLKPNMSPVRIPVTGVSRMRIDASGKFSEFGVREYLVSFTNSRLVRDFNDGDSSKFDAPGKVYEGKVTQVFFYKMNAGDTRNYQIRSKIMNGDETVYLVIKLSRADLPQFQ